MDHDLYIPQEWFQDSHQPLRAKCRFPSGQDLPYKNQIAQALFNRAFQTGRFRARWVGCDAAYGSDHAFLDGLQQPDGVWYFVATNAKEQVFLKPPRIISSEPDRGRGRPKKHPVWVRPSGQSAKPGRSSGCPMGTDNSYGRLQRPNSSAKVYQACRVLPQGWEPELRKTRGSCLVICTQIRGWDHQIFCIQCTGSYLVYRAGSGSNAALAD